MRTESHSQEALVPVDDQVVGVGEPLQAFLPPLVAVVHGNLLGPSPTYSRKQQGAKQMNTERGRLTPRPRSHLHQEGERRRGAGES